jgi:hypothetical protein
MQLHLVWFGVKHEGMVLLISDQLQVRSQITRVFAEPIGYHDNEIPSILLGEGAVTALDRSGSEPDSCCSLQCNRK